MTDSDYVDRMFNAPEVRHANHLTYSLDLLTRIAQEFNNTQDRREWLCAAAMVDAFYVHLRLLGDFLVRKTSPKDFGPAAFGVEWTTPCSAEATRLEDHWTVASQHIVHFSAERVPENAEDMEAISLGSVVMTEMARDSLMVMADFVRAVMALPDSEDVAVRGQRTILQNKFRDACKRVGLDPTTYVP